jgi:hypothetical protein
MENLLTVLNKSEHIVSLIMMACGVICFILMCKNSTEDQDAQSEVISEARSVFERSKKADSC